jgi:glycerate-2-kinase
VIPSAAAARLRALYDAALDAARPGPATREAVARLVRDAHHGEGRRWIVAVGKAAPAMAEAAVAALAAHDVELAGGLLVAPERVAAPHPAMMAMQGDHPVPGILSYAAADALHELVQQVEAEDEVLVLLSGGTSSLLAAPIPGIAHDDVARLFTALLGSGADIGAMNAVRRRFLCWGAGRLAAALAPARVHVIVASDVPGDDLATIGSGPCHGDPCTADDVAALLERASLLAHLPTALREHLEAVRCGRLPETPRPGDSIFDDVTHEIVVSNRQALDGAAVRARQDGLVPRIADDALAGEASASGERIARALLALRARQRRERAPATTCLLWGGETTVTLGNGLVGEGGRSQELALAAARVLGDAGAAAHGIALLAAGTDGRDGPTDAAGAMVGGQTWDAIARAGGNPGAALARHDAYAALARAGALVRTGPTGTNVMDVVIAVVGDT